MKTGIKFTLFQTAGEKRGHYRTNRHRKKPPPLTTQRFFRLLTANSCTFADTFVEAARWGLDATLQLCS